MELHFPDATELFILLLLIALPLQMLYQVGESVRQALLAWRARKAAQQAEQPAVSLDSLPSDAEASIEAIRLAKRQFELRREVEAQEQAKLRREAEAKAKRAAEAKAERSPSPSWISRAWLPLSAKAEEAARLAKMVRERAGSPASGARRALWGSGGASPRPSASPLSRDDRSQPQAARAASWSGCSWTLVISLGFVCAGVGDALLHIVSR